MNIKYDKQALQSGQRMREMTEESPGSMATYNGADMTTGTGGGLAAKNEVRKAGPGGVHAMRLKTDPVAFKETQEWMGQFGETVPGYEFNSVKIQRAQNEADSKIINEQERRRA